MLSNCTITNRENLSISIMVDYFIKVPEIITGGYDIPIIEDDVNNSYIEINEVTGNLPDDFNEFREEYEQEIIEQLF